MFLRAADESTVCVVPVYRYIAALFLNQSNSVKMKATNQLSESEDENIIDPFVLYGHLRILENRELN